MKLSPPLSRFIENLAQYFESFGIPRIGGRILGLLLVSSEPLSAEAISTILKVSRGSVSTNIRFALQVGLAEKVSFPGDRITYYAFPETGLENTLAVEVQGVSMMKRFVEQGLNALSPEDAARSRLEALDEWADFLLEVWQNALIQWQKRHESQSVVQKKN